MIIVVVVVPLLCGAIRILRGCGGQESRETPGKATHDTEIWPGGRFVLGWRSHSGHPLKGCAVPLVIMDDASRGATIDSAVSDGEGS
jgi:hypothetical protein